MHTIRITHGLIITHPSSNRYQVSLLIERIYQYRVPPYSKPTNTMDARALK